MFAYGSGYTASMFSLHVGETADLRAVFGEPSALLDRLSQRTAISHPHFLETIRLRQEQLDQGELLVCTGTVVLWRMEGPSVGLPPPVPSLLGCGCPAVRASAAR